MEQKFTKKTISTGYSPNATLIFILGMHRSGTSCLAGCLERCGLFLGDVSRSAPYNLKGTHELKKVSSLNDRILAANRGTWFQPPAQISVRWWHRSSVKRIVKLLSRHGPAGIKDPRLLLALDAWLDVAESHQMVGTFRHPVAVATSLAQRDGFAMQTGYDLWLRYNTELVRWHMMYGFPLIEYNLTDVKSYRKTITELACVLGLVPDIAQLSQFITSTLEHQRISGAPVPSTCQKVYAYLRENRLC